MPLIGSVPVLATVMALFFGFVTQMASQLQTLSTPMPSQFLLLLPYVATIIAVAGLVGRVRPPAADGIPYAARRESMIDSLADALETHVDVRQLFAGTRIADRL